MPIPDRKPASPAQLWQMAESAMREHASQSALDAGALHGLRAQHLELETQNEALRTAYLELDELQTRYFSLFDMAPVGLLTLSQAGLILEANLHLSSRLGLPRAALVGQPIHWFIHLEDQPSFDAHCRRFAETGALDRWELRMVDADGAIFWAALAVTLAEENDGTTDFRVVVSDISDRKRLEAEREELAAQLRQAEGLKNLGCLAGGIAQDMNDVLGAILGVATVHVDTLPKENPVHHAFEIIAKAATRGGDLVRSLVTFARQSPIEERDVDLNALLSNEVRLLDRIILSRVELVLDLDPALKPILGDPSSLIRALLNLCVNAVDAMPEGGTLTLCSRNKDGDTVEVQILDTGIGMSEEVQARIFDPYFSTKDGGKTSGLGLVLVRGIVAAHRGQLLIESRPGHGTSVLLRFPASQGAAQPGLDAPVPIAFGQALTVLLVDDDDLVQEALTLLLEELGHQRHLASRGEDALALLEGGLKPDVIILDVNMPGLGGAKTLAHICQTWPEIPVLLATGRVDPGVFALLDNYPAVGLLTKPFTHADLVQKLQAIQQR